MRVARPTHSRLPWSVDRPAGIKAAAEIGLSLADGKTIIGQVQRRVVEMQDRYLD